MQPSVESMEDPVSPSGAVPKATQAPIEQERTVTAGSTENNQIRQVADATAGEAVFTVRDATQVSETTSEEHKHRLQYWKGRIDPPLPTWEALGVLESEEAPLPFVLPDGTAMPVTIKRLERFGPNKGVFVGSVEGHPFAQALFSYVNDAVSGVLRLPDQGISWEIRNAGGGEQYFEEVDLNELGECGVCQSAR